jgi:D-tyrosyl-tRNA(Tyr) deacylase
VNGEVVGAIDRGLLVLLGVGPGDGEEAARWMASKLPALRIFADQDGKMNLGLVDVGGAALVVSQFTLYGDVRKGRRPSFVGAAPPELARPLVEQVCRLLLEEGVSRVEQGRFGAHMEVSLVNDGPVTLIVESP